MLKPMILTRRSDRLFPRTAKAIRRLSIRTRRILRLISRTALGFLLGRLRLFGCCSPLGCGYAAAQGGGMEGALASVGVMLGSVSGMGLIEALRPSASVLLIYAASFLLSKAAFTRKSAFPPLCALCMTGLIGAVYLIYGAGEGFTQIAYAAEVLLSAGSCVLYMAAEQGSTQEKKTLGLLALSMSLCMALSDICIAGVISVGRCLAAFGVLTAAWLGYAPLGGVTGLLLGMALDASAAAPGPCTLVLGCAGALGGVYAHRGRFPLALGAVLGGAAVGFWAAESALRTGLLYEMFIASVLFQLPGERFFENLRPSADGAESSGFVRYLRGRTGLAAAAFESITGLLEATPELTRNQEDTFSVFDVAAEQVCRSCERREECWGKAYESTRSAMQAASVPIFKRGGARPEDFPEWFRTECRNIRGYSASVSLEVKALLRSRQLRSRLRTDRELLYRQYADFAAILRDLNGEQRGGAGEERRLAGKLRRQLRDRVPGVLVSAFRDGNGRLHLELDGSGVQKLTAAANWLENLSREAGTQLCCPAPLEHPLQLMEQEPLEAEVGVASSCRGGRAPSGDAARSFKTAEGILYLVVADGMGSGSEAEADSRMASELAEKLLRAGARPESAMRILNTALLLRGEKRLSSLSVDLMSVNLFTGETVLVKYGAAPSYVRTGGQVRVLRGASPAAGTEDAAPDCVHLQLEDGSTAVILSDGAAHAESVEQRLRDHEESLQKLAGDILTEAAARGGWEDDMTVLTLNLHRRAGTV